ncbi:MAG: uncharacterized protein A8A55_2548 [Amphiamblys sp. WSBS2006]|nr:MAG: uncharacterized protein A8A55_2548 [Amphiamblys sp. WSBS2006]
MPHQVDFTKLPTRKQKKQRRQPRQRAVGKQRILWATSRCMGQQGQRQKRTRGETGEGFPQGYDRVPHEDLLRKHWPRKAGGVVMGASRECGATALDARQTENRDNNIRRTGTGELDRDLSEKVMTERRKLTGRECLFMLERNLRSPVALSLGNKTC